MEVRGALSPRAHPWKSARPPEWGLGRQEWTLLGGQGGAGGWVFLPWLALETDGKAVEGGTVCSVGRGGARVSGRPPTAPGWAHVVCALYIPEVQFANVLTMEPIVLQYVPHDRFNKVSGPCPPRTSPHTAPPASRAGVPPALSPSSII